MPKMKFPDLTQATEDGLLALGGNLEVKSLLLAYSKGIFPWPISDQYPLAWFSPDPRGILEFKNIHVGRTLKKIIRKHDFVIKLNKSFDYVIRECARIPRKDQNDTWITNDIIKAYEELFMNGNAYCVEIWVNHSIVAGVYGVCLNDYFCGESMFCHKNNMSKIAVLVLMSILKNNNISYLDTQMVTETVGYLGGTYISRENFVKNYLNTSENAPSKKVVARNDIFSVQPSLDLYLKNSK